MALPRQLFSLKPRVVLSSRLFYPRPIFTSNVRSLSSASDELKKRYPDLSEYDPILDFRHDDTLPGGNPYRKKFENTEKVTPKSSEDAEANDESTSAKLVDLEDLYDDQIDFPVNRPLVATYAEPGEDFVFSENFGITLNTFKSLRKKVLVVRRSVNMTGKGKMQTFNALVVVGNGAGGAGYGEAKGIDVGVAVRKATERAIKNVIFFERYDGRTVFHDIEHKFKATKLKIFARPPGFGVRTNHNIHEVCSCIGIADLGAKVSGSRNPSNVIKALFDALQHQNTPDTIAKSRGKKIIDIQYQYYGVETKLNI